MYLKYRGVVTDLVCRVGIVTEYCPSLIYRAMNVYDNE